ncbi:MAG: LysE/ArgO family amino acid transporter [Alphaproteobacteria bacterium]
MSELAGVATPVLEGFVLSAGLIIAIGAQNAFVLRQGLLRQHVTAVVMVCALSDAVLITIGVAGAGTLVRANPGLLQWATIGGAVFLIVYGALAMKNALRRRRVEPGEAGHGGAVTVIATCLALTFLNPHVYLDTVLLIGAISARHAGGDVIAFAIGAVGASILWFVSLGYGARYAAPIFKRPVAWRVLDAAVALTMFAIAGRLLSEVLFV